MCRAVSPVLSFSGHRKQLAPQAGDIPILTHGQSAASPHEKGMGGNGPGGAWKGLEVVINGGQSSACVQGAWNVLSLPKWNMPVNSTSDES